MLSGFELYPRWVPLNLVERHFRSNRLLMSFCTTTSGLYQGARGRDVNVRRFKGA